MRRIRKTHPPKELSDWLKTNKDKGLDVSYDTLSKDVRKKLKSHFLKEQGHLCAYTGREIEGKNFHMEHLKPQARCDGHEDVSYHNLVACFPGDGGNASYGYGAPVKGSWWDESLFVSPCSPNVERRFKFSWSGKISAVPANDGAAVKTIAVLALDNPALANMRQKAIAGFFGYGKSAIPLTRADAERILKMIDKPDGAGKLPAFVFALKQLLPLYIKGAAA